MLQDKVEPSNHRWLQVDPEYQHDQARALMYDVENQSCKYEDRFKKIAEATSVKWSYPTKSFYDGKSYSWEIIMSLRMTQKQKQKQKRTNP